MNPVHTLMDHLIDYAGLFPPAQLTMREAIGNYAEYMASQSEWALGRFVVPVARLSEFDQVAAGRRAHFDCEEVWRLSALCGPDLEQDFRSITGFNRSWQERHTGFAPVVDTVELRVSTPQEVEAAAALIPSGFQAYFEVLVNTDPGALIEAIGRLGGRAKVRTGGIYPEMIPATADVVGFMQSCHRCQVPFKATAGLQHPLRKFQSLTCDSQGPLALTHGFLNLFLGATFCYLGADRDDLEEVLEEQDAETFIFDPAGIAWQGRRASLEDLEKVRKTFAISFGSCSFLQPLDGLKTLNLL